MSLASGVRSGSDEGVTLADVVQRLKAIEDIVRPLQPIPDALNALEDTVRDQGQQQVALNLALTRMEKQILDQQALNWPAQDLGQNWPTQDLGQNRMVVGDDSSDDDNEYDEPSMVDDEAGSAEKMVVDEPKPSKPIPDADGWTVVPPRRGRGKN
ncbi:hypothetical protein GUJ93_ZPchr0008g11704 [Zizania palustris]|uniref:Uncharacterized protein n=1 Tax=Zizania palustris TaxID=103762 RepID=A0A8J5RD83_ZIZPA|nr:hypothetical protein GUJ93_ZPchr0008g11704 [Zizania palustris]